MKTLICMMGLPRSGKSTWALAQRIPVISPDAVRMEMYGQRFWAPGEKMVWATTDLMVRTLFESGNNVVILDATNTTRWQRDQWISESWETCFKVINTPRSICVERAEAAGQLDLIPVINKMFMDYEELVMGSERPWYGNFAP